MLWILLATAEPQGSALPVQQLPGEMLKTYLRADDYPPEALKAGEQGRTTFEILVGTDGAVKQCTITQTSGSMSLDNQTCRLMTERLRFAPGLDEDGNPAQGRMAGALTWQLP